VYRCTGEAVTLSADDGFDSYLWSTGEVMSSIVVDQDGTYTVAITTFHPVSPFLSCTTLKTIQVIESDEAVLDTITIADWTPMTNSITVLVNGLGDYEYSLDNIFYQDSNIFNGLAPGSYLVYVRDKNGCGIISDDVFLLYYPKYFTPNGDGYHETWQIISSRAEPNLEIYIFDRYGKLITSLDPLSLGWDGTYNGNELPSTDYWFKVIRPDNGKEYRGHFSLKR
jgi:gliding motility-associated-like protein